MTLLALLLLGGLASPPCDGSATDIVPPVQLPIEGPQGIAIDSTDGSLWIVSAISPAVLHVSSGLDVLGSFESPFASTDHPESGGIAYRPEQDTLLVSQPYLLQIAEVEKDGTPTGLLLQLHLPSPPNILPRPFLKGLELDPRGDGGRGSLWVVESVLSAIYEVSLEGEILSSFCAPLDPDGCPGKGAAALVNDVGILFADRVPAGFEVTGGIRRRDRLLRVGLDGTFGGLSIPLVEVGGRVGGFARGRLREAGNGGGREALFVTVESSAELHALAVEEPRILPFESFRCTAEGKVVRLEWSAFGAYESISVLRNGERLATLDGAAISLTDERPPDGVFEYSLEASSGGCVTRARCGAVIGAGQVLREAPFDGYLAVDLTEDASGNLWVTDSRNEIQVYDKELALVASIPGPFQSEGDETSGIAYNSTAGTFFVYNATTNEVAEINDLGELGGEPFPSGVPSDPDDEAAVTAMLFDPGGAGGAGSFWYLDTTRAVIEERNRQGELLGACVHPDQQAEPPPDGSRLDASTWGMTASPGGDFGAFFVSGGRIRDRGTTRILLVTSRACLPLGEEIPADGVALGGSANGLGLLRTLHDGRPVLYVLAAIPYRSRILEVEVRPPAVLAVRDLDCRQPGPERAVDLVFTNPGSVDAISIRRDGRVIATLPGDASTFTDREAAAGLVEYAVECSRGELRGDARKCRLRVGTGSFARRELAGPMQFLNSVARDPVDGTYVASSSSNAYSNSLYRFDPALKFAGSFPSPFEYPEQVAALAIRGGAGVGASELYLIGWLPGARPGEQRDLSVRVTDGSGRALRAFGTLAPKPRGNFVTFPSGMTWDPATDTLWYLERNASAIVNIDLDGRVLGLFEHPAQPHQDFVYNFGIAIDGERGAIYLASAGREDYQITKLVEATRGGRLTGVEIPIGAPVYDSPTGFAASGDGLGFVVGSGAGGVWDLVETRAFDPVAPVSSLRCEHRGGTVVLQWQNGEAYDSVDIFREKALASTLPGGSESFEDASPGAFYRVVGRKGPFTGPGALCEPEREQVFLRGDVEVNGAVNITDAIAILGYLFTGGSTPACLDAADVDDSGAVNITDAIALLGYLFIDGKPPAAPFPAAGLDSTSDALRCRS